MGVSASLSLAEACGRITYTEKMANYAFAADIGISAAFVIGVETGLLGVDDDYHEDEIEL